MTSELLSLSGQTAIVTGAAGGIGRATAQLLVARGAAVVVVDLDEAAAQQTVDTLTDHGDDDQVTAEAVVGDVSADGTAERAVELALERTGRLDILVNNAGRGSAQVPISQIDPDVWRRDLDINLTSQFLFCRAAIPHMVRAGYGRIVNVASAAGMEGHALAGGYAAAKGAVIAMTKTLGKELATTGVIVNAIAPALIGSKMLDEPWFTDEVKEQLLSRIPMRRIGRPEEAAELIGYLASGAVTFSTGAVYDLSGGRATY